MNKKEKFFREKVYVHSITLVKYVRRRLLDPDAAEDIVQNVMTDVWTRIDYFIIQEQIVPLLYYMTHKYILDYRGNQTIPLDENELQQRIDLTDKEHDIVEAIIEKDHISRLFHAINNLEPIHSQIILLSVVDQIPLTKISLILGINYKAAVSRKHRAISALYGQVKDTDIDVGSRKKTLKLETISFWRCIWNMRRISKRNLAI